MMTNTHQNCAPAPPGRCGRSTFMPYIPVSTVSGMNRVAMIVSTFITLFNWFDTADRCASRMLVTRSWKNIASSARPLTEHPVVALAEIADLADRARDAGMDGNEVVRSEEEVDVARAEAVILRAEVDAVEDQIE